MIQLKYPVKTIAIQEIEEQLSELSLAFKLELDTDLENPVLIEGVTKINQIKNIKVFLNQLALEVYKSRNAAC